MMHRLSILIWVSVIAGLATAQYHVSYRAQSLSRELRAISRETAKVEEDIRVLSAEWAYVNQPDRLRKLAEKYLPLEPMKGVQLAMFSDVGRLEEPTEETGIIPISARGRIAD